MSMTHKGLWFAAAALAAAGAASGQGLDVAIVASASEQGASDCRFTSVQEKLVLTGRFASVDIIDTGVGTPTLAELLEYDAVLAWTSAEPDDADAWGDVMADYVDAGGGVVLAVFANSEPSLRLGGRWESAGRTYDVVVPGSGTATGRAFLGKVNYAAHPLIEGVLAFDGGIGSFRPTTTALSRRATEIAQWSDGRTLVAVGSLPGRVDLAFYPPASDCDPEGWDAATDGATLLANALEYVADAGPYCYPDCDRNGVLDLFDFLCYQNKFLARDPYCDCSGCGVCDFFSFLCFQNAFLAGCS